MPSPTPTTETTDTSETIDAATPATGPIVATDDELARIAYNADGLVPAIVQDATTREVLMMAWMTAETLALTLAEGRTVFWSRSRQEVWRKGDTSGEVQHVRAGRLRLRRRHAAVPGRPAGRRRLPHRQPVVLLPFLRRGRHACGRRDLGLNGRRR